MLYCGQTHFVFIVCRLRNNIILHIGLAKMEGGMMIHCFFSFFFFFLFFFFPSAESAKFSTSRLAKLIS
jgi:hypothetical protein